MKSGSFLFKKAVVITDIHFGRSSNCAIANQDNLDFLKWAIDRAKSWGAETCIFMGDWHDNRHSLHISTMMYSLDGIDLVNNSFENVWWLPGNHDLYYRDKRDAASISFLRYLPNIKIVRDPLVVDDVAFLPWLVGDENKTVGQYLNARYVFSHLELPGFLVNAMVEAHDAPHLVKPDQLAGPEYVFSGHFHKRQHNKNILYTGNTMPHSFSDTWDSDRGMMLLEWGKEPVFEAWPDQPLYRNLKLSDLINDAGKYLRPKMAVNATMDMEIDYSEMQMFRDAMKEEYGLRKFELIDALSNIGGETSEQEDVQVQSVDMIIEEGLRTFSGTGISGTKLADIYNNL